ncbi:hypothetical protein LguiB_006808 [Lonicera macranthoides]
MFACFFAIAKRDKDLQGRCFQLMKTEIGKWLYVQPSQYIYTMTEEYANFNLDLFVNYLSLLLIQRLFSSVFLFFSN